MKPIWHIRTLAGLGLALGLFLASLSMAGAVPAQMTAFKQAVAVAASQDRALADYYRTRDYRPVWTGGGAPDRTRRQALLRAIDGAAAHGLPLARYDAPGLLAQMQGARTVRDLGQVEVALSRTFLRLARDLEGGVLRPSRIDDGIKREVVRRDPAAHLAALTAGDPRAVLRGLAPQTNEYARLMKEKLRLEHLRTRGGWGPSVSAGVLKPGQAGAAVVALRDRMIAMGYMSRSVSAGYDASLQQAVQGFQADHGLEPDGVAGAATLAEINRPVRDRLQAVMVTMERERWFNRDRGARHILVNLADFSARILDADKVTFRTRAVVGKNAGGRRSPEFSDEMDHMVINPTWHVPRSIVVKEYLPKLQRNPNAVSHLRLYNSRGQQVSRGAVNFSAYDGRSFPFAMKQPPSQRNALGLVKFMFPNKHNIYLHDTPEKALFARNKRDFSHGCIRLHQPFEFAYEMLSRQEADPKAFFHRILNTGRETRVNLETPVPVHIIYRTAVTVAGGRTQYRGDVYGRDAKIWSALQRAGVSLAAVRG